MKMKTSDKSLIFIILNSCELIIKRSADHTIDSFKKETMLQDAIIEKFVVISSASNKLSKELKILHDNIPWDKIVFAGNHFLKNYNDVIAEEVWEAIHQFIPQLIKNIKPLLEN